MPEKNLCPLFTVRPTEILETWLKAYPGIASDDYAESHNVESGQAAWRLPFILVWLVLSLQIFVESPLGICS